MIDMIYYETLYSHVGYIKFCNNSLKSDMPFVIFFISIKKQRKKIGILFKKYIKYAKISLWSITQVILDATRHVMIHFFILNKISAKFNKH